MSKHKTPLRYPGGKQKLAPFVLEVLQSNGLESASYAEPYAGGAGVGIELLLTGKISHFYLNDSCAAIYSFWRSILDHTEDFCRRIIETPLTVEQWKIQREVLTKQNACTQLEVGFATFYLNRCNRSGIIAGGGIIGGLSQAGKWKMDVRFPKQKLIDRIRAIAEKRAAITVTNLDAEQFIRAFVPAIPARTLIYFDPPYYRKASGLYFNAYNPQDHARIAAAIQRMRGTWMVSYDNTPEIRSLYSSHRQFAFSLQYNAATAYKGREVFFFSDDLNIPETSSVSAIQKSLWRAHRQAA